jgi:AcrR family transcriptional regulator
VRGKLRIAQILEVAAEVFLTQGYSAATTNGIAAQAGMSPGSLYRFFRNKEEIAEALACQYAAELARVHTLAFDPAFATASAAQFIDSAIDPLVTFLLKNPAFKQLLGGTDVPPGLREATAPLHDMIASRALSLLAARYPDRTSADLRLSADLLVHLFRGGMPLVAAAKPRARAVVARHLKMALAGYIEILDRN